MMHFTVMHFFIFFKTEFHVSYCVKIDHCGLVMVENPIPKPQTLQGFELWILCLKFRKFKFSCGIEYPPYLFIFFLVSSLLNNSDLSI